MLRSGKVRYKPFHCSVMSVLLAIVLMLPGCSSFEGVTASGSSEAMPIEDGTADQLAGQEMNTLQNPLPSAAEVIAEAYSEAETSEDRKSVGRE